MMKKTLLALTILAVPLITQAQTQQKRVSPEITQQAIEEFVPAACRNGLRGFANEVEQCYMQTDDNSPMIEKCLLGDMTLMAISNNLRKQSDKLGSEDITKNIIFISEQSWKTRLKKIFYPRFKKLTGQETAAYFGDGENIIANKMNNCLDKKHQMRQQ